MDPRSAPTEPGAAEAGAGPPTAASRPLSARVQALLACPWCGGALAHEGAVSTCTACDQAYEGRAGQPDLRLRRAKRVDLPLVVEPLDDVARRRRRPEPMPLNPAGLTGIDPDAYPRQLANGNGLTRELISWFPVGDDAGVMLDMGCGDRRCEPVLRETGLEYVGMDIAGDEPDLLGVGEALPFRDRSFDFVFTLSVVPHTTQPLLTMRELFRVLKPGGRFVGTFEFLEPCHMQSRHHVTALGVQDWVETAGLELEALEANDRWLGMDALLQLGAFYPRLSWRASGVVARALDSLHHLQTRKQRGRPTTRPVGEGLPERVTGGFRLVATRPR